MNAALATSTSPQDPATGAGGEANTQITAVLPARLMRQPYAVVVTVVTHDEIHQQATLHIGGREEACRTFQRASWHGWTTHDPEFICAEDRLGLALAEYMDRMDLPACVANMLPLADGQPSDGARQMAAKAVEAMRHD